jgi:hypothetical protein
MLIQKSSDGLRWPLMAQVNRCKRRVQVRRRSRRENQLRRGDHLGPF